jgi:competence protein ComEC
MNFKKSIVAFSLLLALIFSSFALAAPSPALLTVHFVDVGQADCILVRTPGGHSMLVDAGNNADADTVTSYLAKQGVKRLDVLVGTHPHEDHIGGLDVVIQQYQIGQIYMPKVRTNTKTFRDVLLAIKTKGLKVKSPIPGFNIDLDPTVNVQILAPNSPRYKDLNNYSIVLKVTYNKTSFLLTGDAERESENEMLLSSAVSPKADVLKVGHHGSNSSTSAAFLKAVAPKYAVICVGKDNKYGHPSQTTINRLKRAGVKIYRTDLNGNIIAKSDGQKIVIKTTK